MLAAVSGGWANLMPALGAALALLGVAATLSGAVAVSTPYPMPPSTNPFTGGGGRQGIVSAVLLMIGALESLVICLPLLGLLLPALLLPSTAYALALLVAGPVYGVVVGMVVRRAPARRWVSSAPEVLASLAASRG